jgi:predicted DNA-binding transcriptional regulator AlpA
MSSDLQTADAPSQKELSERALALKAANIVAADSDPNDAVLCTKRQLAKLYNRCPRTIDRWVEQELIPGPIPIGARNDAFVLSEHRALIARAIAERDASKAA